MIRKANINDIDKINEIYEGIHTQEEKGEISPGWKRGVYPTRQTAIDAVEMGEMFVETDEDRLVASAVINKRQVPEYINCPWKYTADDSEIMVLHTLAVHPEASGRGYAKAFVKFYEEYALSQGCHYLRFDTQVVNHAGKKLYTGLGYREAGVVYCVLNGIPDVGLICLEKKI